MSISYDDNHYTTGTSIYAIHMYTHTHTHTHIYIYIYIYIHTHTHIILKDILYIHKYRTLSSATTSSQNGPGNDGNEIVICILALLEPHHQIVLSDIKDTRGEVLLLSRNAVGVF